jgi:uncharacterized protein YdeI (YjbR/CyaY-like superfamily)
VPSGGAGTARRRPPRRPWSTGGTQLTSCHSAGTLERDDRPREVALPDDLAAALADDEAAAAGYERLAFSHRREYTEWIEGAKKPETRARRVTRTLERLRASAQER